MSKIPSLRRTVPLLRVAASVILLAVLTRRIPTDELSDIDIGWDTAAWFGLMLTATLAAAILATYRWAAVLAALGSPSPVRRLLPHQLAGLFVGNVFPSTLSGDALRATRLARQQASGALAFASVVLDRLSGWLLLPSTCLLAFIINPGLLSVGGTPFRTALVMAVVCLVLLSGLVATALHPGWAPRLDGEARWRRFGAALHLGVGVLSRSPGVLVNVIGAGAGYLAALILASLAGAAALGIDVGPTAMVAAVPIVLIIQVLPLSVGGLGVRESALAVLLNPLGTATGDAVLLGLSIYAANLLVSLLGAPAFASGVRRPAPEMIR